MQKCGMTPRPMSGYGQHQARGLVGTAQSKMPWRTAGCMPRPPGPNQRSKVKQKPLVDCHLTKGSEGGNQLSANLTSQAHDNRNERATQAAVDFEQLQRDLLTGRSRASSNYSIY